MSHISPAESEAARFRWQVAVVLPPYDHTNHREYCKCYRIQHHYQNCGHVYVYEQPGSCAIDNKCCDTRRKDVRNSEEDRRDRFWCFPCQANNLFGNMTREAIEESGEEAEFAEMWEELGEWESAGYLEDGEDNDFGLRVPSMFDLAYSLPRVDSAKIRARSTWLRFEDEPEIIGKAAQGHWVGVCRPSGRSKRWARDMQLDINKLTKTQLAVLSVEDQCDLFYLDQKVARKVNDGVAIHSASAVRIERWVMGLPKYFLNPYMDLRRELLLTTIKYDFSEEVNRDANHFTAFGVWELVDESIEEPSKDNGSTRSRMSIDETYES